MTINEEQFRKAIFELIDNTFKFSNGSSKVEISGKLNNDNYTLTFINPVETKTNINIEEIGAFNQIGREFYEQQGAGLGLAIVKLTSELNKFDFKIYSEDNFFKVQLIFHI